MAVPALRGPVYSGGSADCGVVSRLRHVSAYQPPSGCGDKSSCGAQSGRSVMATQTTVDDPIAWGVWHVCVPAGSWHSARSCCS